MEYISVKDAAEKFNISERRVQKLCEEKRIDGATMISNVWAIPHTAVKPFDARTNPPTPENGLLTLKELCKILSISNATGKNWLKLNKLTATKTINNIPYFSEAYIYSLKEDITIGKSVALKSRRNKKYISGNGIYRSYISLSSLNNESARLLFSLLSENNIQPSDQEINYIVAECAIKLLCQTTIKTNILNNQSHLFEFLNQNLNLKQYAQLIDDLIDSYDSALSFINTYPMLFNIAFIYEKKEDILGLLYISLKNIGDRKATGAYYTPINIVKKLISNLENSISTFENKTVLDPCCGTGNFLLQLPESFDISKIYGNDIDTNSVKITRINMALKFKVEKINILYEHITISDYLTTKTDNTYDFIIGNPPWGYSFNDTEKNILKNKFSCAVGKNIESYDVFIEQSLNQLNQNGLLAFVLPEAILNVKSHTSIRKLILSKTSITTLEYLGNAFDQVQCPCIILELKQTNNEFSSIGMKIKSTDNSFIINTERNILPDCFSFTTNDSEYLIIKKILDKSNKAYLLNNADFALGIVTGNNKEYITHEKNSDNEIILKGTDIDKFQIKEANNYISFTPNNFQQIAPLKYYRAPEKLLYRFISNQLTFAYDNKQTLSLNSCNIVIPHIKGLEIKYILAILNSRIAQFIFTKQFNSLKVLRSHIEQIPIPIIDYDEQLKIIDIVNLLLSETNNKQRIKLYNDLDLKIAKIYKLNNSDYAIITRSLNNQDVF